MYIAPFTSFVFGLGIALLCLSIYDFFKMKENKNLTSLYFIVGLVSVAISIVLYYRDQEITGSSYLYLLAVHEQVKDSPFDELLIQRIEEAMKDGKITNKEKNKILMGTDGIPVNMDEVHKSVQEINAKEYLRRLYESRK